MMDPLNVQQRVRTFAEKLSRIKKRAQEEGVDFHRHVPPSRQLTDDVTKLTDAIVSVIRHPRGNPNKEEFEKEVEEVVNKIDDQFHAMHQEVPPEVQKNLSSIREHLSDKKKGERYRLASPAIEALPLQEREYSIKMESELQMLAELFAENPKEIHQEAALFWLYGFLYREGADEEQIYLQTEKWDNYLAGAGQDVQALFQNEKATSLLPIAYETDRQEIKDVKQAVERIREDPNTKIFDRLDALY